MPNPTLFDLLTNCMQEFSQIEEILSEDEVNPAFLEAEKMIREEFIEDFRRFVRYMVMPRAEFIAYWENDEQCQEAVSKALNPILVFLEKGMVFLKAIAYYRSAN
jgi:hypothetical protein